MKTRRYRADFYTKKKELGGKEDDPKWFGGVEFVASGNICPSAMAYRRASLEQQQCEILEMTNENKRK